jgi:polynucleotide 5'-kinase involved in rRNA processing
MGEEPLPAQPDGWQEIVDAARSGTTMIIGSGGTGKTTLARFLLERVHPAALVSADMGQPAVGVPTCLGLAFGPQPRQADALWFISAHPER